MKTQALKVLYRFRRIRERLLTSQRTQDGDVNAPPEETPVFVRLCIVRLPLESGGDVFRHVLGIAPDRPTASSKLGLTLVSRDSKPYRKKRMSKKNKTSAASPGFRRILCPVDFFPASLRAFDYALKLASHYGGRLHVLHVVAPVGKVGYETPPWVGDMMADLGKGAERRLEKLKPRAARKNVPISTETLAGDIDQEILRAAEKDKADLIVMGTHGRRGFKRWILGSVTERIMRHTPIPLLAAGSTAKSLTPPPEVRRILVPADFSPGATDALACAFSIARECGATVTLMHVVPDLSSEVGPEITVPLVPNARKTLGRLVPADMRASTRIRVDVGTPYRMIQRAIQIEKPGLVVMSTHGKGAFERVVLGSTADRVVRAASGKCAFLLIPPGNARGRRKTRKA